MLQRKTPSSGEMLPVIGLGPYHAFDFTGHPAKIAPPAKVRPNDKDAESSQRGANFEVQHLLRSIEALLRCSEIPSFSRSQVSFSAITLQSRWVMCVMLLPLGR